MSLRQTHPPGEQLDLSVRELDLIAQKLARVLAERVAISLPGAFHRLCESGPSKYRLDPRAVTRALAELANNRRPRRGRVHQGPWQPVREILVDSGLLVPRAKRAADEKCMALERLTATISERTPDELPNSFMQAAQVRWSVVRQGVSFESGGSETMKLNSPEYLIDLSAAANRPLYCWITNSVEWLFPDDERLWQNLGYCAERDAELVLIARKIAIATFPVLKRVRAFGLQLHQVYVTAEILRRAQPLAEEVLWPRLADVASLQSHPVIEFFRAYLRGGPDAASSPAAENVRRALKGGLASASPTRLSLLRQWGAEANPPLPATWHSTIQRWSEWSKYRPPIRRVIGF